MIFAENRTNGAISRSELIETLLTCRDTAMSASSCEDAAEIMQVATELLNRAWATGIFPPGKIPFPMQPEQRRYADHTNVIFADFGTPHRPKEAVSDTVIDQLGGRWGRTMPCATVSLAAYRA